MTSTNDDDNDNDSTPNDDESPSPSSPRKDTEGLLEVYDVVVCGTGLVHSLVAASLSMAGWSVLHCDGSEQYGETDTSMNWNEAVAWARDDFSRTKTEPNDDDDPNDINPSWSQRRNVNDAWNGLVIHDTALTPPTWVCGTPVRTPYGDGVIVGTSHVRNHNNDDDGTLMIQVSLEQWTMADGSHPVAYVCPSHTSLESLLLTNNDSDSRLIRLDLGVRGPLLLGRDDAVRGLLQCRASDYLEFQAVDEILFFQNDDGTFERMPCSKADVFASSTLKPLEKRKLMKFMRALLDWADEDEGSSISSKLPLTVRQEQGMEEGRSRSRPQNKASSSTDDLKAHCDEPLWTYASRHLGDALANYVVYGLCHSYDRHCTVREGRDRLLRTLQSVGVYGPTSFLVPVHGVSEIGQAACRKCAVHGGTYLLRRRPVEIMWNDDNNNNDETNKPSSLVGVRIAPDPLTYGLDSSSSTHVNTDKILHCRHVVVGQASLLPLETTGTGTGTGTGTVTTQRRIYRRVSVVYGHSKGKQVYVLPPRPLDNNNENNTNNNNANNGVVIQGVCLDATTGMVPPGYAVLYLTCECDNNHASNVTKQLEEAAKLILCPPTTNKIELWHVTYSLPTDVSYNHHNNHHHHCVHVSALPQPSLTVDDAFREAAHMVSQILPHADFLKPPPLSRPGTNSNDDEPNEEQVALQSALELLQTPTSTPTSNEIPSTTSLETV